MTRYRVAGDSRYRSGRLDIFFCANFLAKKQKTSENAAHELRTQGTLSAEPTERSGSSAPGAMTSSDEDEVAALQRRLHKSGPLPQTSMVRAALAMARDTSLTLTAACDRAGVKPGSRARAAQYRDRIKEEGFLPMSRAPEHPLLLPSPSPIQDYRMEHEWPPPSSHSGPSFFDEQRMTAAECNAVVQARYPALQAPRCHRCRDRCVLVRLVDHDTFHCSECSAWLEPSTFDGSSDVVYWSCELGDCNCEFEHGGVGGSRTHRYTVCHSCTDVAAQVEWSWVPIPEIHHIRSEAFFDTLHVANDNAANGKEIDFRTNPRYSRQLEIATRLGIPCNPNSESYPIRLLVSEDWIANNVPEIWYLDVEDFKVSEDGKRASRRLYAFLKLSEEEGERTEYSWAGDHRACGETTCQTVTYAFPSIDSKDWLTRRRQLEKLRQLEYAAIRRLGGRTRERHRVVTGKRERDECDRVY